MPPLYNIGHDLSSHQKTWNILWSTQHLSSFHGLRVFIKLPPQDLHPQFHLKTWVGIWAQIKLGSPPKEINQQSCSTALPTMLLPIWLWKLLVYLVNIACWLGQHDYVFAFMALLLGQRPNYIFEYMLERLYRLLCTWKRIVYKSTRICTLRHIHILRPGSNPSISTLFAYYLFTWSISLVDLVNMTMVECNVFAFTALLPGQRPNYIFE